MSDAIEITKDAFESYFDPNDVVLITGATGTLGYRLLQRLAGRCAVRSFTRDPHKLQTIRTLLGSKDSNIEWVLGDVNDLSALMRVVEGATVVIHAASMKVISTAERNVAYTIETNIQGTMNLCDAVTLAGDKVRLVLGISSDKAPFPANLYGASKMILERIFFERAREEQREQQRNRRWLVARYGNIFGSSGSVMPIWRSMIREGKTLTLTDPEATRFFFPSLDDAIDVLAYTCLNPNGMLVVPKMKALRMLDLVVALGNPEHRVVGRRYGEKRHETLLTYDEMIVSHPVRVITTGSLDILYTLDQLTDPHLPPDDPKDVRLIQKDGITSATALRFTIEQITAMIERWDRETKEGSFIAW